MPDLQDRMLVTWNVVVDNMVASSRDTESSFSAFPFINKMDTHRQWSWDKPNVACDMKALWEGPTSEMDKVKFLASKIPRSNA